MECGYVQVFGVLQAMSALYGCGASACVGAWFCHVQLLVCVRAVKLDNTVHVCGPALSYG